MARRTPDSGATPKAKGRQPTHAELEDREEYAYHLLASGLRKSEIKARLRDRFGPVSARSVERWLARARARLLLAASEPRAEQRCVSLAFYRAMLADPTASHRDRLAAVERIDKLLGLAIKVPPVEQLCEYLGCTREELAAATAAARRPSPPQETP